MRKLFKTVSLLAIGYLMKKQDIQIFLTPVLVLWIAFFPLSARGESGSAIAKPETVHLQLKWLHQFQFAGYYAASEKGFYKDAGLDVIIDEGGPAIDVAERVKSGQANFGVLASELVWKRSQGEPFVVIAAIIQHSIRAIIVRRDNLISSPADLIGKKVMLTQSEYAEILSMFKNEGINKDKLNILEVTKDGNDRLLKGEIDGINGSIANQPYMFMKKGVPVNTIRPINYGIDFYGDCLFTTEKEINDHPDRVAAFRQASLKGWNYAMSNQEELIDIIINRYNSKNSRDHLKFEAETLNKLMLPDLVEVGHMNLGRWERIVKAYSDFGFIKPDFSMEGFIYDPDSKPSYKILYWSIGALIALSLIMGIAFLLVWTFNSKLQKAVEHKTFKLSEEVELRRQKELSLRESENKSSLLADMLQSSSQPFAAGYSDGRLLLVNKAYCSLVGYTEEELRDVRWNNELTPPEWSDIESRAMAQLITTGQPVSYEKECIFKDGRRIPIELFTHIRRSQTGEHDLFYTFITDLTARKQHEKDTMELNAQLHQAQKMESVGRLAGGVAHDFNNMLGIIIGYTDLSLEMVEPDDPLHENLIEILNAAKRSSNITRQLLAFARKQTVTPKILDINDIIEEMLKMLNRLIGENIHLKWRPGKDLWKVKIDPSQIDQILANLCVNARDAIDGVGNLFIETGNVTVDNTYCSNHVYALQGDYVVLTVSDDGCGMNRETLENIFEPFFTTKALGKGTGLGLATVYGIVKQNNGFVNVYSEPEKGTTFRIYIPGYFNNDLPMQKEFYEESSATRGAQTILLVEDEPALLKMCEQILESLGYRVLVADLPGKAIHIAQEHDGEIHLLITDVVMPEMNGKDLFGKLLPLYPHIKCLFMSGYTADMIEHNGVLDEGMQFIQKPFSQNEIATRIRDVLISS